MDTLTTLKNVDGGTLYFRLAKRAIDIAGSAGFIICFAPIYIAAAIAVFLQDFHNPIYSQERVGRFGIVFTTYKFRSMVFNADQIMKQNVELYNQLRNDTNKVKDDPRITKIGKFIRKYSIDEFPQMFNIFLGQMSLVGPRPLRPDEYQLAIEKSAVNKELLDKILTVKPGLTGYWQTHGRSNIKFNDRMVMEADYATRKSILLDITIILRTPYAILKGEGAY